MNEPDFESSVLVLRNIGWPFVGGIEAYRHTRHGGMNMVRRIDFRIPGGGLDVRLDDIKSFLQESKAAGTKHVIVDLENVREVFTCLLGFWVFLKQEVENGGGSIVFAGPTPRTLEIIRFMKLDAVLTLTESLVEALDRYSVRNGRAGA